MRTIPGMENAKRQAGMEGDGKPGPQEDVKVDQLEEALEQLEPLSNANQALLKTLSHDLRTPLNTIIGFADMTEQEVLGPMNEPQYREFATDIHEAGRAMLTIVNDLLDIGRFENFQKKEKNFRHLIELAPDMICVCRDKVITMINPAGADMLGMWPAETLIGRKITDFAHQDYKEILGDRVESLVAEKSRVPMLFLRPDGREVEVEIAALTYEEEDAKAESGRPAVMLMARDVSERNRALKTLVARENHIRKIMDTVVDGIITFDQRGNIDTANPAAEKIFGYHPGELINRNLRILMDMPLSVDQSGNIKFEDDDTGRILGGDYQVEGRRQDGSKIPVEVAIGMLKEGERHIFIGALRDITERKEQEERLRYLATRDPLTRMPNRRLFTERLEEAIQKADEGGSKFAILFIDLDHFKNINDALGHVTGDMVLQSVGERLQNCLSDDDMVAHLSGDEFPILLNDVQDRAEVEARAQEILREIAKPFVIDGREIYTTGSVGIVIYPDSASTIGDLMRNVDTAAYHAKDLGRDTFQFYTQDLSARVQRRMEIETGLRHALEGDQLKVFYQPKADLGTRTIIGAEALLR